MALPSAEQVTNKYLYGTDGKPEDRLNPSILDHRSDTSKNKIEVDITEYMTDGAGRFVNSANFNIVEKFFNTDIPPGTYTKTEMLQRFGHIDPQTGKATNLYGGYIVNQIYLGTNDPDYAERAYIWGTTKFKVADGVKFVVNPDGTREIRNFAIIPEDIENFDFDGGAESDIGNAALEPVIDPSGIGRTVELKFTGLESIPTTTLTQADFINDVSNIIAVGIIDKAATVLKAMYAIEELENRLFSSGSQPARFLDAQNRPIIYGTNNNDSISEFITPAKVNLDQDEYNVGHKIAGKWLDLGLDSNLYPYINNGIAYVAGDGDDKVSGTNGNDALYGGNSDDSLFGGNGDDEIYGDKGNDTLDGGDGNDILFGGEGEDYLNGGAGADTYFADEQDTIEDDAIGEGQVIFNNRLLTGGTRKEGDAENTYTGNGNEYVLDGSTLTVNGSLTIRNYDKDKNSLNIVLSDDEPNETPETGKAETATSPIVIDLDGDGIETLKTGAAYFDLDGDALSELTGWVSPDDGLLALDRNGDGRIGNGGELFGNHTLLSNGKTADNGFLALAEYDDNGDKTIDAQDAAYANLKIWRDLNGNGNSDEGELQSLADAGVSAISTDYKNASRVDAHGHQHRQTASVTLSDGSVSRATDVWFKVDTARRINSGDITLTVESLSLANAKGFGKVHDLRQAIILDPGLKELLNQYTGAADGADRDALLDDLIYRWTGVADVDPHSRDSQAYGHQIDARQLVALESLTGRPYVSSWNKGKDSANPLSVAASILKEEYQKFKRFTAAQIQAQTNYAEDLDSIRSAFGSDAHSITVDWAALENKLQTLYAEGRVERIPGVLAILTDLGAYSPGYRSRRDAAFQTIIDANASLAPFFESGILFGTTGDDNLSGVNTGSAFIGFDGNDRLQGQKGNDSYYIFRNQGDDNLADSGGMDQIVFGSGIGQTDLAFSRDAATIHIQIKNADGGEAGSVRIDNFFNADGSVATGAIERFRFIDGSTLSQQQMLDALHAASRTTGDDTAFGDDKGDVINTLAGNDTIYGLGGDDRLYGDEGDDILHGGSGNDMLTGGTGNDALYGNQGDDTLYGGEGDDSLNDGEGANALYGEAGNDTLLGTGVLDGGDGDDTLRGQGADTLLGGAGDDVLETLSHRRYRYANTLAGGSGNDTLYGSYGDDTYRFERGDGQDLLIECRTNMALPQVTPSTDTLRFGDGITADDLDFTHRDSDLIIGYGGGDTITVQNWFRGMSDHFKLNHIAFADGTSLTQAEVEKRTVRRGTDGIDKFVGYRDKSEFMLLGDGNDQVWGRGGDDIIYGENGNDYLKGEAGNDTLYGGRGNDVLIGGDGSDTYVFAAGENQTVIRNQSGTPDDDVDVLRIEGIANDALWLSRYKDDLMIDAIGSSDRVVVQNWYADAGQRLDSIQTDGASLSAANVDNLINAMAAFGSPRGGEIRLTPEQRPQFEQVLAANWQ
ncbi:MULTISPECIES: calcium-binding protein [unclassified Brenneria]|uniref:calcium-binding protein n=1 Tax=unclassified Brenneria TaxID=2634434 RepID=UPI0029C12FBE|nr:MULTISPECIES: calcium-binding protein [unclassified Brenneria]MDX5630487.1 calcium-binding protein [Brenneria sp. L3-3Z]MDX5697704.1 calcium-binding protein [Brenneria sp. L4-2C]